MGKDLAGVANTGCKASCLIFLCLSFPTGNNYSVVITVLCAKQCQTLVYIITLTPILLGEGGTIC